MFEIDKTKLRESLETILRNQINVIEDAVGWIGECDDRDVVANATDTVKHQYTVYKVISKLTRDNEIDTRDYDLTCSRLMEKGLIKPKFEE